MSENVVEYIVKATIHIILIGRIEFSAGYIGAKHSHSFHELRIYKFDGENTYHKEIFQPNAEHSFHPSRSGVAVYILFSGIEPDITKLSDQLCEKVISTEKADDLHNRIIEALCCINSPALEFPDNDISRIINYIKNNLSKKISVSDIAQSVYMTPQYLGQFFKKQMGMSVLQYVNEHKMILAKNMLLSGQTVADVSEYLGYDDISYFSKVFKKYYGMPPANIKNRKIYK